MSYCQVCGEDKRNCKGHEWTCPNCRVAKFDSQRKLIAHALPCKQGANE